MGSTDVGAEAERHRWHWGGQQLLPSPLKSGLESEIQYLPASLLHCT